MILGTNPNSIEVVNQSECRLAEDITYEFPGPGEPFGPTNLFLNATAEDIERATDMSTAALSLSSLMVQVRRQADILGPGGYRKSDTLDGFETCTIGGQNFNLLRDTALLVAVQDIPQPAPGDTTQLDEWDCNKLQHVIEGARLLGAVMMDANLVTRNMGALAARFLDHYDNTEFSFRNAASNGACALLQAVRVEYLDAVRGGPLEALLYPSMDFSPEAAIQSYRVQNPFIVRLANQLPDVAS